MKESTEIGLETDRKTGQAESAGTIVPRIAKE
jgi:hypothetical protein